ncbi:hypothetical protein BDP27DRAFT_1432323 [Rhodocollybia butyracea]|uniref:Uncharacterized protein n=1 Tax=Rhodocollybia butyracea TaxID=206335 RepID=A0A9P5P9K5_9AGAR|nr:hypothetical protein BDP27DRAFT_1432323 [Rhodocollybia butyracea]
MFSAAKTHPISSLVHTPKPIQTQVTRPKTSTCSLNNPTGQSLEATEAPLLQELWACISKIPSDFESAGPQDELAGSELWETWDPILNQLLQRPPEDTQKLIKGGKMGVEALYQVFAYLMKEGVDLGLLEGKIGRVVNAINAKLSINSTNPSADLSLRNNPSSAKMTPLSHPVINIDDLPDEIPLKESGIPSSTQTSSLKPCPGLSVTLPKD